MEVQVRDLGNKRGSPVQMFDDDDDDIATKIGVLPCLDKISPPPTFSSPVAPTFSSPVAPSSFILPFNQRILSNAISAPSFWVPPADQIPQFSQQPETAQSTKHISPQTSTSSAHKNRKNILSFYETVPIKFRTAVIREVHCTPPKHRRELDEILELDTDETTHTSSTKNLTTLEDRSTVAENRCAGPSKTFEPPKKRQKQSREIHRDEIYDKDENGDEETNEDFTRRVTRSQSKKEKNPAEGGKITSLWMRKGPLQSVRMPPELVVFRETNRFAVMKPDFLGLEFHKEMKREMLNLFMDGTKHVDPGKILSEECFMAKSTISTRFDGSDTCSRSTIHLWDASWDWQIMDDRLEDLTYWESKADHIARSLSAVRDPRQKQRFRCTFMSGILSYPSPEDQALHLDFNCGEHVCSGLVQYQIGKSEGEGCGTELCRLDGTRAWVDPNEMDSHTTIFDNTVFHRGLGGRPGRPKKKQGDKPTMKLFFVVEFGEMKYNAEDVVVTAKG